MKQGPQCEKAIGTSSRAYREGRSMFWSFGVLGAPFRHLDRVYIPIEMPIFSSNRGYIGGFNSPFYRPFCHPDNVKMRRKFELSWSDCSVSCFVRSNNTDV